MMKRIFVALLLILGHFGHPASAQVSIDVNPGRAERTREDLQELVGLYEQVLRSPAYSEATRENARVALARIRSRLEDGDFRLGDRIVLLVQGEPNLPDTVAVQAGPSITLSSFGEISLRGVLRSEVEEHLTEALGRFIRQPVVQAKGLMRLSVLGAVAQPGFYVVPADMLVTEALMVAGGPANDSRVDRLRVERGSQVLMEGEELQEAVRAGWTLDQLDLQAGDQLFVPQSGGSFLTNLGVIAGVIGSLGFLAFQFTN